jgi:hypothetical protein
VALARELDKLSDSVEALNSLVFDQAGLIWCTGVAIYSDERPIIYEQIVEVLNKQNPPLVKGGRIDRVVQGTSHFLYCRSFAQIYVVGVWFDEPAPDLLVRRSVSNALARIEALTMLLPPPEGPDTNAGVAAKRA